MEEGFSKGGNVMTTRRRCTALLLGLAAIAGFWLVPAPAAPAATSCSGVLPQDFDDDGRADVVVARTLPETSAGVVDIVMTGGTTQQVSADSLGYTSAAGDRFGASVHIGHLDTRDNCPDLAIGAPGTGGGAVYVVRGTGAGVAGSAVRLTGPAAGDRFGTTVVGVELSFTGPRLLVGAPGTDLPGAADAGALHAWQLDDAAAPDGAPTRITYTDLGATPGAGDQLGSVLGVSGYQVLLGVPERDVSGRADAGEVVGFGLVDEVGPTVLADRSRVNQDSPGAATRAEAGDRFGAAVAGDGSMVFVGVPGEDLDQRADTGLATSYAVGVAGEPFNWKTWHQGTAGVPGGNEAGDAFGAAVHVGWVEVLVDGDPVGRPVYLVGAPGEDVGRVRDAGTVTVLAPRVRRAFSLAQGSGLPGRAERGDRVGAAFSPLPGEYDGPFHDGTGVVVGVPGEDVGEVPDAGVAVATRGLLPRGDYGWTSRTSVGGPVPGGRYAATLPTVG